MVSSFGLNSVYNSYQMPLMTSFKATNPIDSISTFERPSIQSKTTSKNLIEQYLNQAGINNLQFTKTTNTISTPSGIGNLKNRLETDALGREILSINYTQSGSAITQNLKTTSPDGTTVEKVTTNDNNIKKTNLIIKDKSGKILVNKEKSYEKLNDDCAKTVVNGETYNISGLSDNIISVEHNGKTKTLDLLKMTDNNVEKMSLTRDGENENESFENRSEKISDKERETLYSKIKSLGGDDLIRLANSVDEIAFLDTPDGCLESFYNKHALIYSKEVGPHVILHELGHAVNHKISDNELLSSNSHFKNIREYEIKNFRINRTNTDTYFYNKFTNADNLVKRNLAPDMDSAESRLRDETFAEGYVILNSTDILDFDQNIQQRALSLTKYCPKTLAQIENYAC